jgi:hypothetical protein
LEKEPVVLKPLRTTLGAKQLQEVSKARHQVLAHKLEFMVAAVQALKMTLEAERAPVQTELLGLFGASTGLSLVQIPTKHQVTAI